MKKCTKCNLEKNLNEFSICKSKKDGLQNQCKQCKKDQNQIWLKNNPNYFDKYHETNSLYRKTYNNKNKEKTSQYNKTYNQNNPNKKNELNKVWLKKRRNNPIYGPLYKMYQSLWSGINRGLKNNFIKSQPTLNTLGLESWDLFKEHIEKQFTEEMNWDNYGKTRHCWSLDHIIPISSAKTEEEVYKLNHYTNLQPMWHVDNIKKSNKCQ
jgi:hypothetical protein